ncbi:arsenate reductase (glutaredoxin) [Winogradskyella sp. DF17]|uniref:Arsenate reductase (Glutaredoxin) n=1 Tax=Winogradskyella pelagia TaxID=2819984 RepID=A0ABS3T498_9FLAO|nr:arsenate reductase (glutaredoxin) [Winogradskyella sp. DF17]MBO3117561.1 arsenate reductase (glutaredoxin) [Winogradskyella sp. DF17]
MITILHNPRCRKSREGLSVLENLGKEFEIRKYLDDKLSEDELKTIISKLDINPKALIRKSEAIWKENYKSKTMSDDELITAMVEHPKLIERPIVIHKNKAVVGRPSELILSIIK